MEFFLILVAPILGSAAIGFVLNRFVIRRIARDPARALASAAVRAVFLARLTFVSFGAQK
jgi:branched-subunit amino acid ABC-type transport system permease component